MEYRVFFVSYYIRKYLIGTQSARYFFFFSKVLERKKYSYIYIYTHVIKKKKKKKKIIFSVSAPRRIFSRSRGRVYTLTPPGRSGALPANEGLCPRNNTCSCMRYALTPAAADFVRFAWLSCVWWYKLPGERRKRDKREILRKICIYGNNVVPLQPNSKKQMNMKAPEIKFDHRNYRKHSEQNKKVIKKSLQELGAGRSVVIDADDTLVAGNGVYEQAQKLKMPVRVVETDGSELVVVKRTDIHADDEKRRKLALADNAASDLSEWDDDLLLSDWAQEALAEFGVVLPETEIQTDTNDAHEDDFDEDNDKVETVCKKGDIWQLGRHRLLCGDSTDQAQIAQLMGGVSADLFLTDPPYNVDYEGSDGQKIQNDKMGDSAFHEFLSAAFSAANTVLKPGCAIYIWHADSEGYNFRSAFKKAGWTLRQCIIWVKNSLVLGRQDYQWKHEPCLYGWKDGAAHYFTNSRSETTTIEDEGLEFEKMKKDELVKLLKDIYSDKTETTIIYENKPSRNAEHPTMKPIRLLARLIRNSSRQGQTVLDTFGGSGSTLIACEQMNRDCYTMELDQHYCDVIIARWEKLTGKKAIKINNN